MEIEARLLFGASYAELQPNVKNLLELINEDILQYASPYYDSAREDWIVGTTLPNEISHEKGLLAAYFSAKAEFERLTGYTSGRLIASVDVT